MNDELNFGESKENETFPEKPSNNKATKKTKSLERAIAIYTITTSLLSILSSILGLPKNAAITFWIIFFTAILISCVIIILSSIMLSFTSKNKSVIGLVITLLVIYSIFLFFVILTLPIFIGMFVGSEKVSGTTLVAIIITFLLSFALIIPVIVIASIIINRKIKQNIPK